MKCCEFALAFGEFEILYRDNPSVILRFERKMTVRCGEPGRGSDSPPGCHSLPRLRFAYPLHRGAFGAVQTLCFKLQFIGFHTPSKGSDRSRGPKDAKCSTEYVTNCLRRLAAKLQFTEFHTPSKGSDRSRGPKDALCPVQLVTNCPRRPAAGLQFAILFTIHRKTAVFF